ncbi:MAG TPA: pirin family protein [Dehalococcoidia bacterium]|nr:pirin family protein [Dehalococcoidia bacterium]
MPAATTDNILILPRVSKPDAAVARQRPVKRIINAPKQLEGEGFQVRRPFPNADFRESDPFLLLDHLGAVEYAPGEAKGAPWHPHRGFETVTYIMDGAFAHHDSTGGGGVIENGSTQWMTAGAGILHDEMPTEELVTKGGLFHGVQLWVNLPRKLKMTPPRYQDIAADKVVLLSSDDGGALIRLIAGDLDGHAGPGVTWTPITYVHATVSPGSRLELPWKPEFNALAYVLSGSGSVGAEAVPFREGQMAVFGPGDAVMLEADRDQDSRSPNLDVLVLGGQPLREPVFFHGPFVMSTREEIFQAITDYHAGKLGTIPASYLAK